MTMTSPYFRYMFRNWQNFNNIWMNLDLYPQLSTRVAFHEHLLPVCLPPTNMKQLKAESLCMVIGWGKREDRKDRTYNTCYIFTFYTHHQRLGVYSHCHNVGTTFLIVFTQKKCIFS